MKVDLDSKQHFQEKEQKKPLVKIAFVYYVIRNAKEMIDKATERNNGSIN